MDVRGIPTKELCELYSRHLLSTSPNLTTIKNCQKELRKRGLKAALIYASVKFEFSDGVQDPIEIHVKDGVIKELWLKNEFLRF